MDARFNNRKISARSRAATVKKTAAFAALLITAIAGVTPSRADVQSEPIVTRTEFNRYAAAQVIRTYPMPGDPHDAEASFNELYAAEVLNASASKEIERPRLQQGFYIPRPGDPHDDFASWLGIVREFGLDRSPSRTAGVAAPAGPGNDTEDTPSSRPDYFPRPGDPHDDLFTE